MKATLSHHILEKASHLDLFLEIPYKEQLITYSCEVYKWQKFQKGESFCLYRKQDHRKIYLKFEGKVREEMGYIKILWKGFYKNKKNTFKKETKGILVNNQLIID